MRFNTPSSSTPLMHTNWGNNRTIPSAVSLADGNWHHLAVVYDGNYYMFYIDGVVVRDDNEANTLAVQSGGFTLGKGYGSNIYKGLMDDFVIADWPMSATELAVVRENSQEPDGAQLDSDVAVEVAYGGTLRLSEEQEFTTLSGDGAAGTIELNNDSVLSVQGVASATSTVFYSAVSGNGAFVKNGADYTLTLAGGNSYTGATEVQEGTLALLGESLPEPQAWYRFDDSSNLGKDSSGNGYDLGSVNSPSYNASGLNNGAAEFDVADQDMLRYASGLPATFPTGNSSYTVAAWCNPDLDNTTGLVVYWGSSVVYGSGASLFRFGGETSLMFSNFDNNLYVYPGYNLFTNSLKRGWHHIVSTYDGTTRKRTVYIDGIRIISDTLSSDLNIQSQLFQLGGAPYSTANYYDGLMDDVMIFDTALTEDQVVGLMDRAFVPQPIARYTFDDESEPGQDSSGNDLDLTPQGSVAFNPLGKHGGALELSRSVQGYLSWTNGTLPSQLITEGRAVTLSAWINPVTGADSSGCMIFLGVPSAGTCHLLGLRSINSRLGVYYSDGATPNIEAAPFIGLDRGDKPYGWHHVAAVYTGDDRTLYLDGVEVAQDDRSTTGVTSGSFYIGYKPSAPNDWFQGLIDEVNIYDIALSRNQILKLMRGWEDVLPLETSLDIASGAEFDLNGESQQVGALSGSGSLDMGDLVNCGSLTVSGTGGDFSGAISGYGDLMICGGAQQTLSGASTFVGAVTVSNATLLVENTIGSATGTGNDVEVLAGGLLGGSGSVTGDVTVMDNGGFVTDSSSTGLTVDGTVALPDNGVINVTLPQDFSGGQFVLVSATQISGPADFNGWSVDGAPDNMMSKIKQSNNTLSVNVFYAGTLILVR